MTQLGQGMVTGIPQLLAQALPIAADLASNLRANAGQLVDTGIQFILNLSLIHIYVDAAHAPAHSDRVVAVGFGGKAVGVQHAAAAGRIGCAQRHAGILLLSLIHICKVWLLFADSEPRVQVISKIRSSRRSRSHQPVSLKV